MGRSAAFLKAVSVWTCVVQQVIFFAGGTEENYWNELGSSGSIIPVEDDVACVGYDTQVPIQTIRFSNFKF